MKSLVLAAALAVAVSSSALASVSCPISAPAGACAAHNAYIVTLPAWVAAHPDRSSLDITYNAGGLNPSVLSN